MCDINCLRLYCVVYYEDLHVMLYMLDLNISLIMSSLNMFCYAVYCNVTFLTRQQCTSYA